jgi:hypothetical protein
LQSSSTIASTAASTTGKYDARQPAITALTAIFSTVAGRMRGGMMPTMSSALPGTVARNASTLAISGGVIGKPSVQPLSKNSS